MDTVCINICTFLFFLQYNKQNHKKKEKNRFCPSFGGACPQVLDFLGRLRHKTKRIIDPLRVGGPQTSKITKKKEESLLSYPTAIFSLPLAPPAYGK